MIQYLFFVTSKLLNISDITKRIGNFFKLPIQLSWGFAYPELALRERIGLLNGIIASEITNNDRHAKAFGNWLKAVNQDKSEFLASIRENMTAMYPEMMRKLVGSELTDREIDYVCLYAIGLTGKEIGVYLDNRNHYNIAASIRKKLGINDSRIQIGKFISEMFAKSGKP